MDVVSMADPAPQQTRGKIDSQERTALCSIHPIGAPLSPRWRPKRTILYYRPS